MSVTTTHAFTLPTPAHASPIALHIDDETTEAEWEALLRKAAKVGQASSWWIGDALVYGEIFHHEGAGEYDRAAEITGLDYGTLRNLKTVAARFPVSRRRDTLSWSHHAEVVGLDLADQMVWLDRAEREAWSQKRLREELSSGRLPGGGEGTTLVPFSLRTDESRVERWRAAAAAAGLRDGKGEPDLRTWALNVLDEAAA